MEWAKIGKKTWFGSNWGKRIVKDGRNEMIWSAMRWNIEIEKNESNNEIKNLKVENKNDSNR